MISMLCDGLVRRGHDVTLFAAPGSTSSAQVHEVLPACHPDAIERALYEADHVAQVFAALDRARDRGEPFDVLHDHCGFTTVAMADRIDVPIVHTLHGPFTEDTADFYLRNAGKARLVAISRTQRESAPAGLPIEAVVPNPIDVRDWPLRRHKQEYLLWAGRMTEDKGPHRAVAAARAAGMPLILVGPVQPGQEEYFSEQVSPLLDDQVRYLGEVGGQPKRDLFADARALLMPIRWNEPFGMVMVEALACGTPVIAFAEGAAVEIVLPGGNGYLVADEGAMARAVSRLDVIDPAACRASVARRFDVGIVAAGYEAVYQRAVQRTAVVTDPARISRADGSRRREWLRRPPAASAVRRTLQIRPTDPAASPGYTALRAERG
jgi:glycosyltransferase involved in cell wall biosynthesis